MADDNLEAQWAAALDEEEKPADTGGDNELDWDAALREQRIAEKDGLLQRDDDVEIDWAAALEEQRDKEQGASVPAPEKGKPVRTRHDGLHMLLKIPLEVAVQLGGTKMMVNDLIQLGQGSIVELDKDAGAPMDLMVNGNPLGSGEVVVVNEHFGLRILEMVSPQDRLKSLV